MEIPSVKNKRIACAVLLVRYCRLVGRAGRVIAGRRIRRSDAESSAYSVCTSKTLFVIIACKRVADTRDAMASHCRQF